MGEQQLPPGSRILIYARVSPRDGSEDGELSIESQITELRQAAAGWGWDVLQVYVDQLLTGATDDRPAFQRMIARAQRDDVAGILVWRFSRFARDDMDSMYYKALLARAGVKVISYKEPIPEAGGWGALIERIIEIMDRKALDQIREDTRRAMRQLAREGFSPGGRVPIGFMPERVPRGTNPDGSTHYSTRWVPDPATAPDIQGAFEMMAAGASYREINERYSILANRKGLWYIFRNPAYKGDRVFGRKRNGRPAPRSEWVVIEDAHPAVVSAELWDRAQAILDRRRPHSERRRGRSRPPYLLSGLATCGLCGAPLNGASAHGHGGYYRYYRCSRQFQENARACALPHIRQDALESAVFEQLSAAILTPARIQLLVDEANRLLETMRTDTSRLEQRARLQHQLHTLEHRMANLVTAIELHGVQAPDVAARLDELAAQKQGVKLELDALDQMLVLAGPLEVTPAQVAALVRDLRQTFAYGSHAERRALLRAVILRIEVYPDRGTLTYRPPLDLAADMGFELLPQLLPKLTVLEPRPYEVAFEL